MLRLLSKDEVAKQKGNDRSREVAEGLKLTRRVDGLRELTATEEKLFEDFRTQTLAHINKEITEATEKRDKIIAQTAHLDADLKKELSKTDRQRLDGQKEALVAKEKSLIERKQSLDLQEIDIALTIKEQRESQERQASHEVEAKRLHGESSKANSEAEQKLESARAIERNTNAYKLEVEADLARKDALIRVKNQQVEDLKKENLNIKRENDSEKLRLADERKTLERALERIRKNRI